MTYLFEQSLETGSADNTLTMGESNVAEFVSNNLGPNTDVGLVPALPTPNADPTPLDTWETVEQNVEDAISAMEEAFQFVGLGKRKTLWCSLRRCYRRAKSIRDIRGIEQLEDRSDIEHFMEAKCTLGVLI